MVNEYLLITNISRFIVAVSYITDFLMPTGNQIIDRCQCNLSAVTQYLIYLVGRRISIDGDEIFFITL